MECRKCEATIVLAEDHAPTAHGLCHSCASAELDEVLAVVEEAGVDVSKLDSVAEGVRRAIGEKR